VIDLLRRRNCLNASRSFDQPKTRYHFRPV
jgi:hypothetical protein